MKKKECPSCAMEIDAASSSCPVCGYEFPQQSGVLRWVAVFLILFSLLLLLIRFL